MDPQVLASRARQHAALGDPVRLAIADELARSDRAPVELRERFGLESNLLAHHLDVLEAAGLDRPLAVEWRRAPALRPPPPRGLPARASRAVRPRRALFVCTHNSARSQLAAALWTGASLLPRPQPDPLAPTRIAQDFLSD